MWNQECVIAIRDFASLVPLWNRTLPSARPVNFDTDEQRWDTDFFDADLRRWLQIMFFTWERWLLLGEVNSTFHISHSTFHIPNYLCELCALREGLSNPLPDQKTPTPVIAGSPFPKPASQNKNLCNLCPPCGFIILLRKIYNPR